MNIIWIIVQAQVLTHSIGVLIGGQDSCVLFLPVGRTCTFRWNHDGWWRYICSADGARDVFRYAHVMNIKLVLAAKEMCIIVSGWQWYSVGRRSGSCGKHKVFAPFPFSLYWLPPTYPVNHKLNYMWTNFGYHQAMFCLQKSVSHNTLTCISPDF